MKENPPDYFIRQKRIELSRRTSRLRKRKYFPYTKDANNPPFETVYAPKEIGIHRPSLHLELTQFLRKIRRLSLAKRRLHINFSKTDKVGSTGMLLMLAEIDRIFRSLKNKCHLTCDYPENELIEKVFQQIGLFQIFKKPYRAIVTENDKSVFHWKYATGVSFKPSDADQMLKGVKGQLPKGYLRIVTGIEEAMDNAIHHAYLKRRGDRLSGIPAADERRWWVFAEILDGWLHVNFCDLGLGIPVTLPAKWGESVKDILSLTTISDARRDLKMIERSLMLGRTRTSLPHRGKGLKNILKAARELRGRIQVYSNMAVVGIDFRPIDPIYERAVFKRSIMGTVIQWSVPVTDTQETEDEHG